MSQQVTVEAQIKDLELFKQICEKNGVSFEARSSTRGGRGIVGTLRDRVGRASRTTAEVFKADDAYGLIWDNDTSYCSLSQRLGRNAQKLVMGYNEAFVTKGFLAQGGQMIERSVLDDGRVVAVYAVAGGM